MEKLYKKKTKGVRSLACSPRCQCHDPILDKQGRTESEVTELVNQCTKIVNELGPHKLLYGQLCTAIARSSPFSCSNTHGQQPVHRNTPNTHPSALARCTHSCTRTHSTTITHPATFTCTLALARSTSIAIFFVNGTTHFHTHNAQLLTCTWWCGLCTHAWTRSASHWFNTCEH